MPISVLDDGSWVVVVLCSGVALIVAPIVVVVVCRSAPTVVCGAFSFVVGIVVAMTVLSVVVSIFLVVGCTRITTVDVG